MNEPMWFSRHERRAPHPRMLVDRNDPAYRAQAEAEAAFWANPPFNAAIFEAGHIGALKRFIDESYTDDPQLSWMEDLIRRGPFRRAAVMGSTEGSRESAWLEGGGSRHLDVYDISPAVLAKARARMGRRLWRVTLPSWRARFRRADLNFVALPKERYDVIWTTASLHHVTNLEYLIDEIEGALCEGGLLAIHDYIGEPKLRYAPERLRAANDVFRRIPREFRWADEIAPPADNEMSPFEAVRSHELLDVVRSRFDVVHLRQVDALIPIFLLIDCAKLERLQPSLLDVVFAAEREARQQSSLQKCSMYGVFRKRPAATR